MPGHPVRLTFGMADGDGREQAYFVDVPVRIRDIDFAGHAHHSAALLYFEEARSGYWRDVIEAGTELDGFGFVLAEARVRFVARIRYPDTLRVSVRVVTLGRKHFVMEYEARSASGALLLTGTTTQVMYDYDREASVEVPERVRRKIGARDGPIGGPAGTSV